jgi:hypothetical protein
MKKEIIQVDEERGIARVTTADERWYTREARNATTGLPEIESRPSITYVGKFYPKGKGFEAFLKKNGDDADVIKELAGERGSKVHQAIEVLNNGGTVAMGDKFMSNITGQLEELTPDEYWCVMTYVRWWDEEGSKEYEIVKAEDIIWPETPKTEENGDLHSEPGGIFHFAATRDVKLRRKADGTTGTLDVKTSQDIYPSHIIQVSAIAAAEGDEWQAILRVGYRRTQKAYKFDIVERRLDLVRAAMTIHAYETEGEKPLQRDFPLSLRLNLSAVEGVSTHFAPIEPPSDLAVAEDGRTLTRKAATSTKKKAA